MKRKIIVSMLAALLPLGALATLTAGCSATATRQSTGEYIDDAAITAKVKAALVSDETVQARDVNVETYNGVVQLSGFVDTAAQKSRAATVAQNVAGVKSVQNKLEIK